MSIDRAEELRIRARELFQSAEFLQTQNVRPEFEQADYAVFDHLREQDPAGFDHVLTHRIASHRPGTLEWILILGPSGISKTALIGGLINNALKASEPNKSPLYSLGLKDGISAARNMGKLVSPQGKITVPEYEFVGQALDEYRWAALRFLEDGIVIEDNVPDTENFDKDNNPFGPKRVGIGSLRFFAHRNPVSLVFLTTPDKSLLDATISGRQEDLRLIDEGRKKGLTDQEIVKLIFESHLKSGILESEDKTPAQVIDGALRQGNSLTLNQQLEGAVDVATKLILDGVAPLPLNLTRPNRTHIKAALRANNYKSLLHFQSHFAYPRLIEQILGEDHLHQRGDYRALILSNERVASLVRRDFKELSQQRSLVTELRRLALLPANEALKEDLQRIGEKF